MVRITDARPGPEARKSVMRAPESYRVVSVLPLFLFFLFSLLLSFLPRKALLSLATARFKRIHDILSTVRCQRVMNAKF